MGLKRGLFSPVGGNRRGVITVEEFYTRHLGAPTAPDTNERWLYTPSHSLLSASNGEIFRDDRGVFSAVRERLLLGYPTDIKKKKLAAHAVFMAQAGQYNYTRCIRRGELGAAQLAVFEFVKHAISAVYLLNDRYEPFYKWAYRGLTELSLLGHLGDAFQYLTETDNEGVNAETKTQVIEDISALFIDEFKKSGLSNIDSKDLERHAYMILDSISDASLRNMHIMEGV